jgi:hypothetical protein
MSTDQHTSSESETGTEQQSHRTVGDLDEETMVWRMPASPRNVVHTNGGCRYVSPDHRQIECRKLHSDHRICKGCDHGHRRDKQFSRHWLYSQYIEKERTSEEIAAECSVSSATIRRRLAEADIETRGSGSQTPDEKLRDETWMRVQYIDKNKSVGEIGEMLDCSHTTAWRWLQRHGIETQEPDRTPDARLRDGNWLRARYHGDGLTQAEIGELCGCCARTVREWMDEHNIETRKLISTRDCQRMQSWYENTDANQHDIADSIGVDQSTVSNHLNGRCSHTHD